MPDLSAYPITKRWPARHPDRLQLYSWPTPNGVKVSIMLEEIGLPYEAHASNIARTRPGRPSSCRSIPTARSPAILDPDGPEGRPFALFESGAILLYLAEKTGQLLPADPAGRYEAHPVGFLPDGRGGSDVRPARLLPQVRRPRDRGQAPFRALPGRVAAPLGVLEARPVRPDWIMGEYGIADIALLGWVRGLVEFYGAGDLVDYATLTEVPAWLERGLARPAVQRGLEIPQRT
jgi:GST-like protein